MTERLTKIELPGPSAFKGLLEWGNMAPVYMVKQARDLSRHLRAQADAIDAAADADFRVTFVDGSVIQRHVKTLQEGKA